MRPARGLHASRLAAIERLSVRAGQRLSDRSRAEQAHRPPRVPAAPVVSTCQPGRRWQPGGILTAASTGDSFEYAGNRAWREGDSLRDIDWRATARHFGAPDGGLVVREWREEYFLRVGVILDTHVPKAGSKAARAVRLETLERAVSVCAALSDALAERDYLVDLFAAGPKLLHLTAGRGLAYKEQILDELALVGPTDDEPLSQVAPKSGRRSGEAHDGHLPAPRLG